MANDKLGPGSLTFTVGTAQDPTMQISKCTLTSDIQTTEGVKTLGDVNPLDEIQESYTLEGEAISDFLQADGFQEWCYQNVGAEAAFEFIPSNAADVKLTGTVQIRPVDLFGEVGTAITVPWSFPCKGKPTWSHDHTPVVKAAPAPAPTKAR